MPVRALESANGIGIFQNGQLLLQYRKLRLCPVGEDNFGHTFPVLGIGKQKRVKRTKEESPPA